MFSQKLSKPYVIVRQTMQSFWVAKCLCSAKSEKCYFGTSLQESVHLIRPLSLLLSLPSSSNFLAKVLIDSLLASFLPSLRAHCCLVAFSVTCSLVQSRPPPQAALSLPPSPSSTPPHSAAMTLSPSRQITPLPPPMITRSTF